MGPVLVSSRFLGFKGFDQMGTPFHIPVTAAQVLFISLFVLLFGHLGFVSLQEFDVGFGWFRWERTLLGSTIRFFSSNLTLFISFILMRVLCFVLMAISGSPPLQCWYFSWFIVLN